MHFNPLYFGLAGQNVKEFRSDSCCRKCTKNIELARLKIGAVESATESQQEKRRHNSLV